MADTILRFRPHHLLCMLTYKGNGYSKSFVENFDLLIERMNASSVTLEICKGPDDICAPRLCDPTDATCHCHDTDLLILAPFQVWRTYPMAALFRSREN